MNKFMISLLAVLLLGACNGQTGGHSNLRPSVHTNNVALTNLNLGIEYMRTGNYERALEKLNRAKEADPGYYATYNAFGLLYQELKAPARAEESFKQALSLNPSDSSTLNNYGRFLCQNGRRKDAEKIFQQAADNPLYDTPEIAIANAGTCAMLDGDKDEAEAYFRKALKVNPKVPTALLQMAQISYDRGEYLPARGFLQRYMAVAEHTPASLWLGIQIEGKLGNKDAVSSYALLLRNRYPGSDEAALLKESGAR